MTETKMDYSIGHMRIKYLDLANMSFASGNYTVCNGFLKNFLDTVDEESVAGKQIKKEFDLVVAFKKKQLHELDEIKKNAGYLEAKDLEREGRDEIEINTIHDMKEILWRVSLTTGLFDE